MTERSPILLIAANEPGQIIHSFKRAGALNPLLQFSDPHTAREFLERQDASADRLRDPLPSLVLMDLAEPIESALDFLRWIRSQPLLKRLPVIALAARTAPDLINATYDAGANSFLVRPEGIDELSARLQVLHRYWICLNQNPNA